MTTRQTPVRPALTSRMIHASMTVGVVLFAIVAHLVIRPSFEDSPPAPVVLWVLLGLSLTAMAVAILVLRPRVPRRSREDSADLYWSSAATPALFLWIPLELAAIAALIAYMLFGTTSTLIVAAFAIAALVLHAPALIERS